MNLRHMRYFIAVAEELSFTQAAMRLHIAQPPLSQQIRQLEEELGVTLFQRTKRHVQLTDAGQVLYVHAKQILRATEIAALQTQRAERGEIGRLAVGFFEHMSYTLLPPIYRVFSERFPDVEVALRWFPVVNQADALQRGDVDIAFMRPLAEVEGISTETLLTEPFVLALPEHHPLAAQDCVSLTQCASESFVLYAPNLAPDFHTMIYRLCADAGFIPTVALEVGQIYTCLGLVSSGVGLALVPSSVQRVHLEYLTYRPIQGHTPPVEVMLGWRTSNTSPLLQSFIATAKEVMTTYGHERLE